MALEKLGAVFNEIHYNLKYTPRRFVCHQQSGNMIIIETDHGAFTERAKRRRREESANVIGPNFLHKSNLFVQDVLSLAQSEDEKKMAEEVAHSLLNYEPDESTFGAPPSHAGSWASAVRMISARNGSTLCNYELPEGEAAFRFDIKFKIINCIHVFSIELVKFQNQQRAGAEEVVCLLVGCSVGLHLRPRKHSGGCIYTFVLTNNGNRFDFVHRTETSEVTALNKHLYLLFYFLGSQRDS